MKPELYAEDIHENDAWAYVLIPILPRRCLTDDCREGGLYDEYQGREGPYGVGDPVCGGRGWLYPDMPDWWEPDTRERIRVSYWQDHCDDTWRAMNITNSNEGA